MSLDVYLEILGVQGDCRGEHIFIRKDGRVVSVTREEWDEINPGRDPHVVTISDDDTRILFSANITHNLGKMAAELGVYEAIWSPGEIGITKASQLIDILERGVALLKSNPDRFNKFNPPNGWGSLESLVAFMSEYLSGCKTYPSASVRVSG